MNLAQHAQRIALEAKQASRQLSSLSTATKNQWLLKTAKGLRESQAQVLTANAKDVAAAQSAGKDHAFIDRLVVDTRRLESMAYQLEQIALLPDLIGAVDQLRPMPNGLQIGQMRGPLGVILMIYESRPNVTIDAGALAFKSGNSIILRGGSEAIHTNQALHVIMQQCLRKLDLPLASIQLVEQQDRQLITELLHLSEFIDAAIPRGGKALVRHVTKVASVPVIKHLDGICHVYIDSAADLEQAISIAENAKTQRYGTCNTMETLLVHQDIAEPVARALLPRLLEHGVELRLCTNFAPIARELGIVFTPAAEADWQTEYLAPILSCKVVTDVDAAIDHIDRYGSDHTEAIVTTHLPTATHFLRNVDASSVMVNASTRFADGFEYGLGAEIGISTNRLHVRGPVGLEGLTTKKWVVIGDGHIRS